MEMSVAKGCGKYKKQKKELKKKKMKGAGKKIPWKSITEKLERMEKTRTRTQDFLF